MKTAAFLLPLYLIAISSYGQQPAPRLPPPAAGMGMYLMVLWPPGSPIPGDPTRSAKDHPEPVVTKQAGKVPFKNDHRRIITLPLAAANDLRKDEAVVYLQRLWMGESLAGWEERYVSAHAEFTADAQADTNVLWGPKAYAYDGSGNVKAIGGDQYTYDSAGRLIQSTVGDKTESFKYDSFGNLIEKQVSGANANTIAVDGSSNRMLGVTYDAAGNAQTADGGRTYEYDSFNMMARARSTAFGDRRMVYDANDERIGMVTVGDSLSRWTIRDFEGRIVREYEADSLTSWFWEQDSFYGEGSLLGGETQEWGYTNTYRYGGKRHYHFDHLGSVRVVTNDAGRSLGEHDFYPFGTTITRTYQEQLNIADPHVDAMRFAGQWRDFLGLVNVDNTEYIDNMHARYYDPNLGRFLSVDPVLGTPGSPQTWNRYVYARNSPLRFTDPSGRENCAGISGDTENQCNSTAVDPNVNAPGRMQSIKDRAIGGDLLAKALVDDNQGIEAGALGPADLVVFGVSLRAGQTATPLVRFASEELLREHAGAHAAEFGLQTAAEYLGAARQFILSSGERGTVSFARANGDRVIYRLATNEFAVVTRQNIIRTYFAPRQGAEYYVDNLFKAVEQFFGMR